MCLHRSSDRLRTAHYRSIASDGSGVGWARLALARRAAATRRTEVVAVDPDDAVTVDASNSSAIRRPRSAAGISKARRHQPTLFSRKARPNALESWFVSTRSSKGSSTAQSCGRSTTRQARSSKRPFAGAVAAARLGKEEGPRAVSEVAFGVAGMTQREPPSCIDSNALAERVVARKGYVPPARR